ncbi:PD-(D/E)XK nuclease family protein, partial [Actinoplanes missouriensis]|uniref:RecB family exonuclease n=1 Tax=Actinoplanes missouriensis TaxID=1866 RepID=UPI0033C51106
MTAHSPTTAPAGPIPAQPGDPLPPAGAPQPAASTAPTAPPAASAAQPAPGAGDAATDASGAGDAVSSADAVTLGRGRRPEAPAGPSLSPSRAADFKTCPLLFRFRTIDKLPELPSADQIRGTLVHAVLERLFDLPAAGRTPEAAAALVAPEWDKLLTQDPSLAEIFTTPPPVAAGANKGRVYRAKAYELPEASRVAKGQHVANLLA